MASFFFFPRMFACWYTVFYYVILLHLPLAVPSVPHAIPFTPLLFTIPNVPSRYIFVRHEVAWGETASAANATSMRV